LILDTDPGVDDAFALALACASGEIDLIAVTSVFGNVPLEHTTSNALRLLALCGREDVPVAAGASRPLVHTQPQRARHAHGADGLSGNAGTLPERRKGVEPVGAVALMAEVLQSATEPVTIAAVGPLTNVALLLAAYPELRDKIGRLVIMGGSLAGGNITAGAEFNIWSDPEAARRVLVEETVPTTLVPLDLTTRCAVDMSWLGDLESAGPIGRSLVGLTPAYQEHYLQFLGWRGLVLHDAVAVAEVVRPGILGTDPLMVEVECGFGPSRGAVLVDRRAAAVRAVTEDRGRAVDVAVDTDLDVLRGFLLSRLAAAS
jgi:pyrimidine-specific ribonucleoside hydrolase